MNLTNLSQVAKLNSVYIFLLLGIYYFHPVGYVSLAYYVLVWGTQGCLIQNLIHGHFMKISILQWPWDK